MSGFWDFKQSDKKDIINEHRPIHREWLNAALEDSETQVSREDRHTYLLYGDEEALLIRPIRFATRIGLEIYLSLLELIQHV